MPLVQLRRRNTTPWEARLRYAGVHLQQDRDLRRQSGERRSWYMLRLKLPGGRISSEQFLTLERLAQRYAHDGSLRFTAGQNVQLHGVARADLAELVAAIDAAGLRLGCDPNGQEYNIAAPFRPLSDPRHRRVAELAEQLYTAFYPSAGSTLPAAIVAEYLRDRPELDLPAHPPRKFTIGLGLPEDNSADVYAQDLGLVLDTDAAGDCQAQVYAGGGLTLSRGRADTFASLAVPVGQVPLAAVPALVQAAAALAREELDLGDRHHARLKYLLAQRGVAWFAAELGRRAGVTLAPVAGRGSVAAGSAPGREQADGQCFQKVALPAGRLRRETPLRAGLVAAAQELAPSFIACPDQRLILAGLDAAGVDRAAALCGTAGPETVQAMSCVGPPTCRLAVTESERVLPRLEGPLRELLRELGRPEAQLGLRIAGCPIGCIRPYAAEIGLVGVRRDRYDLYLGGAERRLGDLYREALPLAEVLPTVEPLLREWAAHSAPDEGFASYYARKLHRQPRASRIQGGKTSAA